MNSDQNQEHEPDRKNDADLIERERVKDQTIVIVSDDLKLIKEAKNLLYVDSAKKVIEAERGSPLYDQLMTKLKKELLEEQKKLLSNGSVL